MRFVRETLAFAALAFQVGIVWWNWGRISAGVPAHYGLDGRPDAYGGQSVLLVLPAVALLICGLLTALSFFPQRFNYPIAVTGENRERLQAIGIGLIGWLKVECMWLFAHIAWIQIRGALGESVGLGPAFLPVILIVLAATVAIGVVRMRHAA